MQIHLIRNSNCCTTACRDWPILATFVDQRVISGTSWRATYLKLHKGQVKCYSLLLADQETIITWLIYFKVHLQLITERALKQLINILLRNDGLMDSGRFFKVVLNLFSNDLNFLLLWISVISSSGQSSCHHCPLSLRPCLATDAKNMKTRNETSLRTEHLHFLRIEYVNCYLMM